MQSSPRVDVLTTPHPSAVMADHQADTSKPTRDASPVPIASSANANAASTPRSTPTPLKMSSPSPHSSHMASPHSGHRSSFAENMRGIPVSPRASRQPSLSQQALQDLLNNPPTKGGDPAFAGRDWKTIKIGELVDRSLVRFVQYDTSVEEATNVSALGDMALYTR